MKPGHKIALILSGYILALLGAVAITYFYQLMTQSPDRQAYGAMYEFGDGIYFFAAWAFFSLFPTALALFFLRSYEKFWNVLSWIFLLLAITGPLFEISNTITFAGERARHMGSPMSGMDALSSLLSFFGLARLAAAPFFAVGYGIGALITSFEGPRRLFLVSIAIEVVLSVYVVIHLLLTHQFA